MDYHFYLIDDDKFNAFALPGGHVFVYRGLFDKISREELAFVLGHEIGHIEARHALKRLGPVAGINEEKSFNQPVYLRTHPFVSQRIENALSQLKKID